MRRFPTPIFLAVLLSGCVRPGTTDFGPATSTSLAKPSQSGPVVSTNFTYVPIMAITGKVVMSNPKARFVILSLAPGVFPPKGTRLFAYRNGVRVGEIKISGSQWDDKTVADILQGDLQINDQISDN